MKQEKLLVSEGGAAADASRRSSRWLVLGVLAMAQFMVFLDETVVNIALPSIKRDLGFSQATLAWVVSAYIVVFGGLVLLGGRAADLFGRRRMFLAGITLFGAASLLDGLAQWQGMLLGARALQGVGAALATPAALALVTALFPPGPDRVRALSFWGGLAGLGFAIGILLGGAITDVASWRWVFLINVPVAVVTLIAVPRLVAESRATERRGFDLAGAITVTAGVMTLVYAVVKAPEYGWGSLVTLLLLGVGVALLAAFAVIERRSASPLIPAGYLLRRSALVPNALQLLLGISAISTLFLLTLYIQQVLRYTPLEAGVAYLPLAAGIATATAIANRIAPKVGPRPLAMVGLAAAAIGIALLGRAPVGGEYAVDVLPAMVMIGVGAGLSFVSITTAALARVEDETAGLASGLLSTFVQLGGALGVAALATVMSQRTGDLVRSGSTPLAAQVGGLHLAFLIAGAVALAASLVATLGLQRAADYGLGAEKPGVPEWWITGFATAGQPSALRNSFEEARAVVRQSLSADEEEVWHDLVNCHATLDRAIDARLLAERNLHLNAFDALMHIAHPQDGTITVAELAGRLHLSARDTARLLTALEKRGLVQRRGGRFESRSTRIAATDTTRNELREAAPTYFSTLRELVFDKLSHHEVKQLHHVLKQLRADPTRLGQDATSSSTKVAYRE